MLAVWQLEGTKRGWRFAFAGIVILAFLVRLAALFALDEPVQSDSLAYLTMARGLATKGVLADNFGQFAFYSPGYPLALSPFFALFGAEPDVARAFNLVCSVGSVVLAMRVAWSVSRNNLATALAGLALALWIPSVVGVETLQKENLSILLMLAFAASLLSLVDGGKPVRWSFATGLIFGAALLTGGSVLLTPLAFLITLIAIARRQNVRTLVSSIATFSLGTALFIGPWLIHVDRMIGTPTLSTNSSFNLYLGNNPAATGRFVSIADTPLGPQWQALRAWAGEADTARRLNAEAARWISANPGATAALAVRKLAYFWEPNWPDAADYKANPMIAKARLVEVAQHLLILGIGLLAFFARPLRSAKGAIIAALVGSFWIIHAAAYIIVRYRDPVMPLLIICAATGIGALLSARKSPHVR
jgi:Dolichyl-phosphate-mannose-protein mannosyltransferase